MRISTRSKLDFIPVLMMNEPEPKTQTPPQVSPAGPVKPQQLPDHELLHRIGRGSYGEVWVARGVTGAYRAGKIGRGENIEDGRLCEREFAGLLQVERNPRTHESQGDILRVGRGEGHSY